jgi:hypothetical protein
LVDAAVSIFGVGNVQEKSRKNSPSSYRTAYEYRVKRHAALAVIAKIRPYLRHPEKVRRADILLRDYERLTKRNGKYSPEERAARADLEERLLRKG